MSYIKKKQAEKEVLEYLKEHGSTTLKALRDALKPTMAPSTTVNAANRLVRAGLVRRDRVNLEPGQHLYSGIRLEAKVWVRQAIED